MAVPRRAIVLALIFRSTLLTKNAATPSAVTGDRRARRMLAACSVRGAFADLSASAERRESKERRGNFWMKPALQLEVDCESEYPRMGVMMDEAKPYWLKSRINAHRATSGVVAGVFAVLTFAFALWWLFVSPECQREWKWLGRWLAAIWAVGPPVYFFFEWWSWAPRGADRKSEF